MSRSFLAYLLTTGLEATAGLKTPYTATDADLPRNLWPGEQEPLTKRWRETEECKFWERNRQHKSICDDVALANCAPQGALLFT